MNRFFVLILVAGVGLAPCIAHATPTSDAWRKRERNLKIYNGAWWGSFAVLLASGAGACYARVKDEKDGQIDRHGATAWCGIANLGALATLIGGITVAVRLTRHQELSVLDKPCWPDCRVSIRPTRRVLRWDARRPFRIRF